MGGMAVGIGWPTGRGHGQAWGVYLLIRCAENISEKENSRVGIGMAREDLFDSKIPRERV